jgi:broad specificity phosphatase PhoE
MQHGVIIAPGDYSSPVMGGLWRKPRCALDLRTPILPEGGRNHAVSAPPTFNPSSIRPMLYLVRHASPAHGPDTPAADWELSDDGRRGAETLRHVLPPDAILVSGPEPKARRTLEPSGRVTIDNRFREVERDEPCEGDFRARRHAYLTGTHHPGWEPHAEVIARFDTGIRFWQPRAGDQPLVVATHGMAMTLWLTTLSPDNPGEFWSDLRLPDVFEVNPATGRIGRVLSTQLFQVK